MAKVTSTVIVHRPERVLYYLPEITEEVNRCIIEGICPPELKEYQYAFGTYDDVGVFYLPAFFQEENRIRPVVGIEFRKDDVSIAYPEGLSSVVLPACDIIIQDITYENQLTRERLKEIILSGRNVLDDTSAEYEYVENGIVVVFATKEKLRVIHEIRLLESSAVYLNRLGKEYTEEELTHKAFCEPVTGYYNWSYMWDRLATFHLDGITDYGFVHFDVKDFKMINELYNHQVANKVLIRITQTIEANKDWIYFGARCDNDNFALMIRDMPEEETRQKLTAFFEAMSTLEEDPSYRIYYRCGVVNMRNSMNTGNIVADCAKMAQATGTRMNVTEINYYTNEMHESLLWGKHLKAYLDTAIREDEFLIYLQPKMDVDKECIGGAEALVRWNYKHKTLIPPFRFIPYFEADDSIIKVDNLVLCKVCAKLKEWKEKGVLLFPISVNLSRKHMEQPDLVSHLTEIVDSYGVDRNLIEFELTETATHEDQSYMISVIEDLKKEGFRISMDDFGTGYSSFSLMKELTLDTIKIDKSFVDLLAADADSRKIRIIIRHIVSMAGELGIACVAEGAEDSVQIQALRELGCRLVQGYYYSKPLPVEEFEEKYL